MTRGPGLLAFTTGQPTSPPPFAATIRPDRSELLLTGATGKAVYRFGVTVMTLIQTDSLTDHSQPVRAESAHLDLGSDLLLSRRVPIPRRWLWR